MKIITLFLGLVLLSHNSFAEKPLLRVLSHGSFAKEWSDDVHPIKKEFENQCNCTLEFISLDSSGSLLSRLMLEGKSSKIDLVVGLDLNLIQSAQDSNLFEQHSVDLSSLRLPISWDDKVFLPYDWGYFAFVYDNNKVKNPPESMEELINRDDLKIIIQDPRSSTVGFGIVAWMKSLYGDQSSKEWKKLFKKIVTVTKSWGESYGLFMHGEADMVLSYTTSPAYHIIAEKQDNYKAAIFKEGHFMQIELMAMLKSSKQKQLAKQFMDFSLSKTFQKIIPVNNFMYPVIDNKDLLPNAYSLLKVPTKSLIFSKEEIAKNRKKWLNEWLETSSSN